RAHVRARAHLRHRSPLPLIQTQRWRGYAASAPMGPMVQVRVTVAMGRKVVGLDDVKDPRIVGAFRQAAKDVGTRLANVKCPEHGKGPTDVRLHFDASGSGDLKYESCCQKLGEAIAKVLA